MVPSLFSQLMKDGNAKFEVRFETCLQMTARQTAALLAIAYHSDGKNIRCAAWPVRKSDSRSAIYNATRRKRRFSTK